MVYCWRQVDVSPHLANGPSKDPLWILQDQIFSVGSKVLEDQREKSLIKTPFMKTLETTSSEPLH